MEIENCMDCLYADIAQRKGKSYCKHPDKHKMADDEIPPKGISKFCLLPDAGMSTMFVKQKIQFTIHVKFSEEDNHDKIGYVYFRTKDFHRYRRLKSENQTN